MGLHPGVEDVLIGPKRGRRSSDLTPISDCVSPLCVCVSVCVRERERERERKKNRGNVRWFNSKLWMYVSCGFIIQAGESHTEAAESPFNGSIFSEMERNEVMQRMHTHTHTHNWKKRHLQSAITKAILSRGIRTTFSASFAVCELTSEMSASFKWTPWNKTTPSEKSPVEATATGWERTH